MPSDATSNFAYPYGSVGFSNANTHHTVAIQHHVVLVIGPKAQTHIIGGTKKLVELLVPALPLIFQNGKLVFCVSACANRFWQYNKIAQQLISSRLFIPGILLKQNGL